MFVDSVGEISGEAGVVAAIFLALEDVDVVHVRRGIVGCVLMQHVLLRFRA